MKPLQVSLVVIIIYQLSHLHESWLLSSLLSLVAQFRDSLSFPKVVRLLLHLLMESVLSLLKESSSRLEPHCLANGDPRINLLRWYPPLDLNRRHFVHLFLFHLGAD